MGRRKNKTSTEELLLSEELAEELVLPALSAEELALSTKKSAEELAVSLVL